MADDNVISFAQQARQAWQLTCQKGNNGGLIPNTHNAMIALRNDHEVRDVFALDKMLNAEVMLHEIGGLETCHRLVTDVDVIDMQVWMQRNGFPNMALHTVTAAITHRASENAFHPLHDYLRSLVWDGTKRIGAWLPRYLGAEFTPYTMHIGRMFMVQMVARISQPGCQADHMLVLEGPQGTMKSTACRILGGEYFSDNLPELSGNDRDVSMHLRGKWVIEVSEMHAMSKTEATLLKSFISRTHERYRPFYGRKEIVEPRQCVFIGTTNMDEYLRDPTGGRRFWPVKTAVSGAIDIAGLRVDREQLLAEAVAVYESGDDWWPDAQFESELIVPEQRARQATDIWTERVRAFVSGRTQVTTAEIAAECLVIIAGQQTSITQVRIAGILKTLGWVFKHTKTGNVWRRESVQ